MTSLVEYFQAFHSYAYENALTASARALYYTILGEFNNAYWKRSELSKSVRELRELGGFGSVGAIQKAKAELGTEGILEISKSKKGDVYKLVEPTKWKRFKRKQETQSEHLVNAEETPGEHLVNGFDVSNYTRVKDVKDKEDKKDKKNSSPTATTRTREKRSTNSEEVEQTWFECEGERLKGGVALGLIELENEYGTTAVVDAILEAHRSNSRPRLSFNFVKAVLENQQKGVRQRGRFDNVPAGLEGGVWSNTELPPEINCGT